jgi:mono/diheme cytochrome c family protein
MPRDLANARKAQRLFRLVWLHKTFPQFDYRIAFDRPKVSIHWKATLVTIRRSQILLAISCALAALTAPAQAAANSWHAFLQKHCFECHDPDVRKGGLDLTTLPLTLTNPTNFDTWAKVVERVAAGEMPPSKKPRPEPKELSVFTNALSAELLRAYLKMVAAEGRATQRRLNRYEYEETLRELLSLPYLEVKAFLPEDSESHGFNKIGEALDVSHVQMARYLSAGEFALRQAMAPQVARPERTVTRYHTWQQREFFGKIKLEGPVNRRTFPLVGLELQRDLMAEPDLQMPVTPDPQRQEREALAVVVSTYEPTEIRLGSFRAPIAGRYRLKFSGDTVWMAPKFTEVSAGRRSEPVSIYAETPPRSLRKLGSFDFDPAQTVREMEVWLLAGETIRPDAARLFRSRPPDFKNPLAEPDGMPAVAFNWMEVEGPLVDQWPPAGHQLLFGELPMEDRPPILITNRARARRSMPPRSMPGGVEVTSTNALRDAEFLLRRFMQRAYRSPVNEAEVRRMLAVVAAALKAKHNFTDSMLAGYTAVLSSPGFLYFKEKPGRLNDWALAERLSYFLWNTCPDEQLRALAARGDLRRPRVLRQQAERLLNDPRSRQFINAFLDYWLELRLIAGTAPDEELYPDYQLDDLLVESMIDETQLFFRELVKRDLAITNLIASDFAMLNERLANHYGIAGVEGVNLRQVALPPGSVRGGFLTQASVLKVTANGTTTSPVKRGAWIMARLLGKPPPPPPASVPAVEPDIRGATTIRDQLARHRDQASCNACHRNIDPAGFALESFDVMGAWRERYRSVGEGERVKGAGHNGLNYHFSLGPKVDPSGELPDGRAFSDVRQLRQCLLKEEEQLARNLVQQLSVYATGARIRFSDRPKLAKILANTRATGYGVRSLILELVQSDLFIEK